MKNEKVDQAFELFIQGLKPTEIAEQVGISANTIKTWKRRYNWEENKKEQPKRKKGAQPGNKNAKGPPGNKNAAGHGPPEGNRNAMKHGLYSSRYLPEEILDICHEAMDADPLELLWNQIMLQYAAIIRAQKLMYVRDQEDKTKEISMTGGSVKAYDIQHSWDKHATFMKALSTAQNTLNRMIRRYDDMIHANWDLATEEQKTRIEGMKTRVEVMKAKAKLNETEEIADDGFLEALNASAAEDWSDES